MNLYVARDEMGTLFLYDGENNDYIKLDEHLFPELTLEQGPIEVELIRKNES